MYIGSTRSILSMIRFSMPHMTKTEQRIANFILSDPQRVINLSLIELAEQTNAGQATIVRFCKTLSLSGYSELKLLLAAEHHSPLQTSTPEEITPDSDMQSIVNSVFNVNIQTLQESQKLINQQYNRAFEAIRDAKKICFLGLGDALIPCMYANIKFRRIGYTCYCDSDADMQIINVCNTKKGDVVIAVSYSGSTRHVVEALKLAKKHGATTICITKSSKSPLSLYCDICLYTAVSDTSVGKELIARRIAEQAVLESLYVAVASKMQPEASDMMIKSQLALLVNKTE